MVRLILVPFQADVSDFLKSIGCDDVYLIGTLQIGGDSA